MTGAKDLLVKRGAIETRRFGDRDLPQLQDGEALLRVDCFALTANTVTYAVFGEQMRYWDFFPTTVEGFGRVPCWGHGDVIESNAEGVSAGARFYGYFPVGTHVVVRPARVRADGFVDGSAHRQTLPAVYNSYIPARGDADAEAMAMLFRPLFTTSWIIDLFLEGEHFFGAKQVILSSASSKTAMGLAWSLKKRSGLEVIGLTSPGNAAFVKSLGCYDRVLTYDAVGEIADAQSVYVDFAGAADLRRALHLHLKDNLVHDCVVGATDWSAAGQFDASLPGAQPAFFFAPTHIEARAKEWGREAYAAKLAADSAAFDGAARGWMSIVRESGPEAVDRWWGLAATGKIAARDGVILRV